jgi:hypothetical protein
MLTNTSKSMFLLIAYKTLQDEFGFTKEQIEQFEIQFDEKLADIITQYINGQTQKEDANVSQ